MKRDPASGPLRVDRQKTPGLNRRALLAGAGVLAVGGTIAAYEKCVGGSPAAEVGAVERFVARAFARAFGLRHDEEQQFADGWNLYDRIVSLRGAADRGASLRALQAEAVAEVGAAMGRLRRACAGESNDFLGHRHVRRLPVEGQRYVVTSDHHHSFRGHRTNFFSSSGNLWVYVDALKRYYDAGYVLVENGDVEELVIFDPEWNPGEVEARRELDVEALQLRRIEVRRSQLIRIMDDPANRALVEVRAAFDADRRLIRVAGNHDYDLQRDDFLAILREHYPNLERPSDYLLLDRGGAAGVRDVAFAILHGHQFDLSTNPVSAPRFGETVSECLGLSYQGADRNWKWRPDDVLGWASGRRAFGNRLASKQTSLVGVGLAEGLTEEDIASENGTRALGALRRLFESRGDGLLQDLFKQDIAWEYFKSVDAATGEVVPGAAVLDEVLTGDRFFKFRLLDEESLCGELAAAFPDAATRPTLILGHSHEPRLAAWSDQNGAPFASYLNTASVGQYENLVWAVEVVDGVAGLASWSRVPSPDGAVERRAWGPSPDDGGRTMRAGEVAGVPA